MTIETCECEERHNESIERARAAMPDEETLAYASELFAALGDSTRTRIIAALSAGELCVCDLSAVLGMTKSAVSHQLKTLRLSRIVRSRREGKQVFYTLDDEHITAIYNMAIKHFSHK